MGHSYRISFFKSLVDSTGHPVEACQGIVEVAAADREHAITAARREFAKLKDVGTWSLRADYQTVEAMPARKRAAH
jgi:hypothetical protein